MNNQENVSNNGGGSQSRVSIAALALPDGASGVATRREIVTVPIRKPHRQEWSMISTEDGATVGPVAMVTTQDREPYVLSPDLVSALAPGDYQIVDLHLAITTAGTVYVWPVRRMGERQDLWGTSIAEAIDIAAERWVRVASNMAAGMYDVHTPVGEMAEPLWPSLGREEIFEIALRGKVIDSTEHPFLRKLRGDL